MGNTHGMFSGNNLPRGVTGMRKPASFYSDFIGKNPLSRLVGNRQVMGVNSPWNLKRLPPN